MAGDEPFGQRVLPAQAANARLTLQLRAIEREALTAEKEAASIDTDAAVAQLRARLDPMIEERHQFLDAELVRVRAEADAEVASARDAAARAPIPATPPDPPSVEPEPEPELHEPELQWLPEPEPAPETELLVEEPPVTNGVHPVAELAGFAAPTAADVVAADDDYYEALEAQVGDEDEVDPDDDDLGVEADPADPDGVIVEIGPSGDDLVVEPIDFERHEGLDELVDDPDEAAADEHDATNSIAVEVPGQVSRLPAVREDGSTQVNVVIDAEAFARAFAAVLAPILESRQQQQQAPQPPVMPHYRIVEPEPRKSFWSQAWHADVLLALAAIVIVVVVLVAWMG